MKKKILTAALMVATVAASAKMIKNPVIPGDWSDPGIVRVENDYYSMRSTFGWQPGMQIMHSTDLINWEYIGHAYKGDTNVDVETGEIFGGVWGSDFIYNPNTGKYIAYGPVYVKGRAKSIWAFYADKPEGPYSKGTMLIENDIDPGVFIDDDGEIYLTSKASVIYHLTRDGLSLIGKESRVGDGSGKAFGEGAEIVKRNGYYYYTCSEGGTLPYEHHKVLGFRSKSLKGPWEAHPDNPVKYAPHTTKHPIQGPGHGELIETQNGEWFMTYHAYEINYPTLARQMCMEPIEWSKKDGWWRPVYGKLPALEFEAPKLPKSKITLNQSDEFNGSELGAQWFFNTKPDYSGTSWSINNGKMTINSYKGERNMKETLQRFVFQRFQGKEFTMSSHMSYGANAEGEMAGMLMYINPENYLQFGLTIVKGKPSVAVRAKYGPFNRAKGICKPYSGEFYTLYSAPYEGKDVYLKIEIVDPESAMFYYSSNGKDWTKLGNDELFFGRGGMPDLGWQHTYWTGATVGVALDSENSVTKQSSATFDYFRVDNK